MMTLLSLVSFVMAGSMEVARSATCRMQGAASLGIIRRMGIRVLSSSDAPAFQRL
jgi:hypothetical protein